MKYILKGGAIMENKIIKYLIASETSNTALTRTVNQLIKEGWQPFGSVSVEAVRHNSHETIVLVSQAMVMEKSE